MLGHIIDIFFKIGLNTLVVQLVSFLFKSKIVEGSQEM